MAELSEADRVAERMRKRLRVLITNSLQRRGETEEGRLSQLWRMAQYKPG